MMKGLERQASRIQELVVRTSALRDAGWSYTEAPATGGLHASSHPGPGQYYAGGADAGVLPAPAGEPRGVDSPHDGARPAAAEERSSWRDSAPSATASF
ncbi:expressed unknown protein [Ectocarpus siliculosus]|uniref:Uncharacterized protein n=1 Tax=Ectocarpus siliculosus TaxID=2880 RepID=D7G4D8_ECTSI|nr:expressed unknown protein [Ectocarpus siliculosus]|eukprot:CBJ33684.1 expressed unknown protein [Ectocarpus siliculosus]